MPLYTHLDVSALADETSSPSEMMSFAVMWGLWYLVLLSGRPKRRDTALSKFLYASGVSNMIALDGQ